METPPRAWGRRGVFARYSEFSRNTPTGVGKTLWRNDTRGRLQKHPHGRGEDNAFKAADPRHQETPPRAWGRLVVKPVTTQMNRNTPTGVGKTVPQACIPGLARKHPHGRGEDCNWLPLMHWLSETPPRAWGRHALDLDMGRLQRNTPTGVGKTHPPPSSPARWWKHPHGRGEDTTCVIW